MVPEENNAQESQGRGVLFTISFIDSWKVLSYLKGSDKAMNF